MMDYVIGLAVIHILVSLLIGYRSVSDKTSVVGLTKDWKYVTYFCGISVVVNLIILYYAYQCKNSENYDELEEVI